MRQCAWGSVGPGRKEAHYRQQRERGKESGGHIGSNELRKDHVEAVYGHEYSCDATYGPAVKPLPDSIDDGNGEGAQHGSQQAAPQVKIGGHDTG